MAEESLVDAKKEMFQVRRSQRKEQRCRCQKDRCRVTTIKRHSELLPGQQLPTRFFERPTVLIMNESRLFVGNLAYQTMDNDLQDHFSQAGVVSSVNVMMDKFTGKSRGFAFVEMASAEEANKAVEMFHNKEFQGRALTVNIARPREDRPPRSGGGGGGFRGDRGDRGPRH